MKNSPLFTELTLSEQEMLCGGVNTTFLESTKILNNDRREVLTSLSNTETIEYGDADLKVQCKPGSYPDAWGNCSILY